MGLNAIVRCTCFARPDFTPPPPCAHPFMIYANERIGSWGACEAFREALGQAGWSWFPTFARELPGDNSSETAPPAAAEALRELALFRSLDQIGEGTFLVDTATNEVIHYRVEVDEGVMLWTPSLRVAITDRDLVIIDTDFEVEVFRAGESSRSLWNRTDPAEDSGTPSSSSPTWTQGRRTSDRARFPSKSCRMRLRRTTRVDLHPVGNTLDACTLSGGRSGRKSSSPSSSLWSGFSAPPSRWGIPWSGADRGPEDLERQRTHIEDPLRTP